MAESEIIGANHLGFTKSLFQQYSQLLGLNNNHYPAESAFNYYVNNKITDCLGGTVNIEYTQQQFSIIYADKGKGRIQTPAATPKEIQLPSWKKHKQQITYAPIAKLEKFTGNEDKAQTWINDIAKAIVANNWDDARAFQVIPYFLQDTADAWYQSLVAPPQTF
ncbi:hypothetical protein G9A89_021384 [Geosiphon pyriformis]|nr:hypothetical protein G9A89_021384 [Geosiphon pyriformis]